MSLLVPWFPTPSKFGKLFSIKSMYATLRNHVEERKKAAVPSSDAIDILLADGASTNDIIQFIIGAIFAGVINIGANCTLSPYASSLQFASPF
jgi:sterol 14-demethylase